ncbi:conodipine-P2-like [Ylistrum balloti]|uniref:conodipine-P2-like n=1 Tax=Ylistrum balloti TaxID=509963 RepID=UPI0029059600|nr:conodipine-P2-like [Ylistrum balloti]
MVVLKVIVLVVVLFIAVESQDYTCDNNPYNNGCTIPLDLDIPFRNSFLPACRRHDICYKCGNHEMYAVRHGRKRCDRLFYQNMQSICRRRGGFRRFTCMLNAGIFYSSVRGLGIGRMKSRERVPSFCTQSWVRPCLQ